MVGTPFGEKARDSNYLLNYYSKSPLVLQEVWAKKWEKDEKDAGRGRLFWGYEFKLGFVGEFMSLLQRRRGTTEGGG
ncbi:MAG: hypothetical protein IKU90_00815 [Clostridia bacterium]|nr:hypothetical protein [Clostridia bacterium]